VYLKLGVAIVWVINSRFLPVTVQSSGTPPVLLTADQEITAEPHLPGFRVPVTRLFGG
jgi:hypothetical protein